MIVVFHIVIGTYVGLDTGKSFWRVSHGKISTIAIAIKAVMIISDILHQMMGWIYAQIRKVLHTAKACAGAGTNSAPPTSCMCTFGTSARYYARCRSEKGHICHIECYHLQVEVEGDIVPHCNWVRRCVVDIAFDLA